MVSRAAQVFINGHDGVCNSNLASRGLSHARSIPHRPGMTPRAHLTPSIVPDSIHAASTSLTAPSSLSLITTTSSPLPTLLLPDEMRHLVASQWPTRTKRLEKAHRRLLSCNEVPVKPGLPVEVMQGYLGQVYLINVRRCGLAYVCPICRERILRRRATLWRRNAHEVIRRGGAVYFVTVTLPL